MDELILVYTMQGYEITFRPAPCDCINIEMSYKSFHVSALLSVEAIRHPSAMSRFFMESEKNIIQLIKHNA